MNDEIINNVSTIAVICYGILAPYIAQYLSQEQFSALCIAIVGIILIIISARNPNTMAIFGNKTDEACTCEEKVLNDEYEVDPIDQE